MLTKKDMRAVDQFRRAMQMFAAGLPETAALEVAAVYPAYAAGRSYQQGEYLTCGADGNGDPRLYRVVQTHVSQADWPPVETPALYARIGLDGGVPVWSPPSGAHDAYDTGDVVSHGGKLWRSRIDGNTTEPGSDDRWWEIVSETDMEE